MALSNDRKVILVVDDEPSILRAVRAVLIAQGYEVLTAVTGDEALKCASSSKTDLIVLDIMLPGDVSGLDVCRNVRQWSDVPIIILSAIGRERQKVEALDLGADDYITKPFGMNELTARVRALLRRGLVRHEEDSNEPFKCGDLEVDFDRRVVTRAGVEVKLTPHEYDILVYLSRNADRVITHRQLLSAVWGAPYSEETQLLRVHVGNLRRKIEANASIPQLITTEPGVGYRLRSSLV